MNKTDALSSIPWWVVTDLDGTLMDHAYNWEPEREAIRGLQLQGIPVIPCTSKTAEEVKSFRAAAGLSEALEFALCAPFCVSAATLARSRQSAWFRCRSGQPYGSPARRRGQQGSSP